LQATTVRSRRTKSDPPPAAAPRLVRPSTQPQTGALQQPGQLLVEDGVSQDAVCIAEQAWAPGLGWYTQRTVSVPDEQLDELIARLRFARARRRARQTAAPAASDGAERASGREADPLSDATSAPVAPEGAILPFRPRRAEV
jgi:hypothetical protein